MDTFFFDLVCRKLTMITGELILVATDASNIIYVTMA